MTDAEFSLIAEAFYYYRLYQKYLRYDRQSCIYAKCSFQSLYRIIDSYDYLLEAWIKFRDTHDLNEYNKIIAKDNI